MGRARNRIGTSTVTGALWRQADEKQEFGNEEAGADRFVANRGGSHGLPL